MHPTKRNTHILCAAAIVFTLGTASATRAQDRVLGLDISAWQGNLSTTTWATFKRPTDQAVNGVFGDGRDFVFIRSSRGGTTGYYNQSDPNNNNGLNTLSQRYDDPYFVQNITRATAAGLFAGPYHFARPEIIASTPTSGGIANTGVDEADHFYQMAGPWMRPGYLLPVFDLESGQAQRTSAQISTFAIDFSNRILELTGVRPIIYTGQTYANYVQSSVVAAFPNLWTPRWPNGNNPYAGNIQTALPNTGSANLYGKWDDFGDPQPWKFWQYTAVGDLNGYNGNLDLDVANGGMEMLKDMLVPALLVGDGDAQWTSLSTWNSGQTPVAPVQGPGQVARVGTLVLPAVRLPASNDTVILDRTGANPTVTLASGTHDIRKLYVRETFDFTGGSLNVNYVPSPDSTPFAAQFSAPVTMSGNASLRVHTLVVDAQRTFTLLGGSLTFDTIQLMPHASTPGKITVAGDIAIVPLGSATATITKGSGSGLTGFVDLGTTMRTITVADGSAGVDALIDIPVRNGALTKAGPGTLRLAGANNYTGVTAIEDGKLILSHAAGATIPVLGSTPFSTPAGADLRGGELFFDYTGGTSLATTIHTILKAGHANGFTSGKIFTTLDLPANQALASFDSGTSIRVIRTLKGDANGDYAVDFDDLLIIAQNYGQPGIWQTGNFNYDTLVDFDDLLSLAQNYNTPASFEADWALAQSLVPEPGTLAALAGVMLTLSRRRRNSHQPSNRVIK